LTASKLPELILFTPQRRDPAVDASLPTHIRTPDGEELGVFSQDLAMEVSRRHGTVTRRGRLTVGQPIFFRRGEVSGR